MACVIWLEVEMSSVELRTKSDEQVRNTLFFTGYSDACVSRAYCHIVACVRLLSTAHEYELLSCAVAAATCDALSYRVREMGTSGIANGGIPWRALSTWATRVLITDHTAGYLSSRLWCSLAVALGLDCGFSHELQRASAILLVGLCLYCRLSLDFVLRLACSLVGPMASRRGPLVHPETPLSRMEPQCGI